MKSFIQAPTPRFSISSGKAESSFAINSAVKEEVLLECFDEPAPSLRAKTYIPFSSVTK